MSSPGESVLAAGNTLKVTTPQGRCAEWNWILDVVLRDWLGLAFEREEVAGAMHVTLSLMSPNGDAKSLILGANFWLEQARLETGFATPAEPLAVWRPEQPGLRSALVERSVPVLFSSAPGADLPIDLFGSAFWMLARIEELTPKETDNHDRFSASQALAVRAGFVDRPIIDEYIALLRTLLSEKFPALRLRTPEFRMHLSHDVDAPSEFGVGLALPWIKGVARQLRGKRDPGLLSVATRRLLWTPLEIEPEDPNNTFDYLMSQSERRGLKSAFYFFGGRTDTRADAGYRVAHPAIQGLLTEIHARGHEIGIHPSYNTYLSSGIMASEARTLINQCNALGIEQTQWGGRMHFLRWRWPNTARAWDNASLTYDSTLGFADLAGFRCGTSHEYAAFDPKEREPMALRLRPLVVMECSIIAPRYMGLGYGTAAFDEMSKLKDRCRKYGGGFSLLWHNSHFNQPGDRALYEAIQDH